MEKPNTDPVTKNEINLLSTENLDLAKAEVLCRHAFWARKLAGGHPVGKGAWDGFDHFDIGSNQWLVAWSPTSVVVAFCGSNEPRDWVENVKAFFPRVHPLGGRVHRGFSDVWEDARKAILEKLPGLAASCRTLWITGHSLGGAVATACSAEFLVGQFRLPHWEVVTFGAPRFGDPFFDSAYEQRMQTPRVSRHWCFVNAGDPVPHLPMKFLGYRHVGRLCWFDWEGKLTPVDEQTVGLEAVGAATRSPWDALEDAIPEFRDERAFEEYLNRLAKEILIAAPKDAATLAAAPLAVTVGDAVTSGVRGIPCPSHHALELYLLRLQKWIEAHPS